MPENKTKNITPENVPQEEFAYYDEYQDFHGMNYFMLMIIAAAMIPWLIGGVEIFGFKITGWAWVIPTIISGLLCLRNISLITFPIGLWFIWACVLVIYWYFGKNNPDALQSLFQMLSPLFVGCAASVFRPNNWQLENIVHWITRLALLAWIIIIIRVPIILAGNLPGYSFMAAEMIGLLLLGACYASFYACGSHRHLYYYLFMLVIPLIALTRGPLTSMLSCLPFTTAPLGIRKRIILSVMIFVAALVIFNSDRIQGSMFQSGSGEISELRLDNPNFKTSGRSLMWEILWRDVKENPWFGNGWNSHRDTLIRLGIPMYLPHNDWLKLWHDIGILSTFVFLLTMLLQIFFLVRIARWSTGSHQLLAYGAATAFIPYMLIMFTDNVVLYVQFFGNLHFALIGIIYGTISYERAN